MVNKIKPSDNLLGLERIMQEAFPDFSVSISYEHFCPEEERIGYEAPVIAVSRKKGLFRRIATLCPKYYKGSESGGFELELKPDSGINKQSIINVVLRSGYGANYLNNPANPLL
ncbi:hypothetical protein HYU11_03750 [Candidatus Woesearchaeota archaeon]|nr:hypothetical protein [Candidatus Woesearchaeota archaeon]